MTYNELDPPAYAIEDRYAQLYQVIGDVERSSKFYDSAYIENTSEVSTTGATKVSLDTELEIYVPDDQHLLAFFLDVELKSSTANGGPSYALSIDPLIPPGSPTDLIATTVTSYSRFLSDGNGVTGAVFPNGDWQIFKPDTVPGVYTFNSYVSYVNISGPGTAYARNSRIWAAVI